MENAIKMAKRFKWIGTIFFPFPIVPYTSVGQPNW